MQVKPGRGSRSSTESTDIFAESGEPQLVMSKGPSRLKGGNKDATPFVMYTPSEGALQLNIPLPHTFTTCSAMWFYQLSFLAATSVLAPIFRH